ncbi:DUF4384 domain-containing protein [Ottowia sp.]|uniref:DUF4384 domain-containing protein n=1 Tax=Ottowia sp. TaxID=1898956 RepID=UPI0039E5AC65
MTSATKPLACSPTSRPSTRPRLLLLALSGIAAILAGCGIADVRKDADYQDHAISANRPVVRPVRSISSFSESLACMDHMLRAAEVPTTLITSKQFPDYSGKVPVGIKDMVVTSLSQMSHLSNAFRYVDYEVDIARQDTVQNLTTILLNNNQMQLQRPALYVSGSVAFVDQNVISNRMNAGTSAKRLDTGYSSNKSATVVALEAHMGDFRTRTIIPGMDSANEVVIGGGGAGLDLAGRIGSYGVTFNVGRDYALGTGGALRTLVDLAMVELVGKWARVPYWQCLMLDQTNPSFQRQMRDWYDESGPGGQFQLVRSSLITQGYLPQGSDNLSLTHPAVRSALAKFQADRGLVVSGVVDFPTYDAALRNFVTLAEDGSLARIGWSSSGPLQVAQADGTQPAPFGRETPAPWRIDMQIENPQPAGERAPFTEGEQIFLSATVTRASHLYCYYVNAAQEVIRLLPNALQTSSLVSANQALRIPDWIAANPGFILDAGKPGMEGAMCVATAQDPGARLPTDMQGPALTTLSGVRGFDGIQQRFAAAMGTDGMVSQAVQWSVVARPPHPPATSTSTASTQATEPAPAPAPKSKPKSKNK